MKQIYPKFKTGYYFRMSNRMYMYMIMYMIACIALTYLTTWFGHADVVMLSDRRDPLNGKVAACLVGKLKWYTEKFISSLLNYKFQYQHLSNAYYKRLANFFIVNRLIILFDTKNSQKHFRKTAEINSWKQRFFKGFHGFRFSRHLKI
jgi:hypothetical protein